jgi:hypothetical protein
MGSDSITDVRQAAHTRDHLPSCRNDAQSRQRHHRPDGITTRSIFGLSVDDGDTCGTAQRRPPARPVADRAYPPEDDPPVMMSDEQASPGLPAVNGWHRDGVAC